MSTAGISLRARVFSLVLAVGAASSLIAQTTNIQGELEFACAIEENGKACAIVQLVDPLTEHGAPSLNTISLDDRCEMYSRCQEVLERQLPPGVRVRTRFKYSPTVVVDVHSTTALHTLAALDGVARVEMSGEGSGGMGDSRPMVGADVTLANGWTGAGTVAAVLDSGIDSDHPDFEGAIIHQHHFLDIGDTSGPGAEDGHGHGTNVAGIIAGRGAVARPGLAPDAKIVAIKVLDDSNVGHPVDWALGVEHCIDLHLAANGIEIDVINMSLVTFAEYSSACDSVFTAFFDACQVAQDLGITVLACSGNTNSTTHMTAPGCYTSTVSVGAVFDTLPDRIWESDSDSGTSRNEGLDLLAPGYAITSSGVGGGTRTYFGCSQATPHVAGLACLMREADPGVTPAEILEVASDSGVNVPDSDTGLSFPRIDVAAAVTALLPTDCNNNGVLDAEDISGGTSQDCNDNLRPDECDVAEDGNSEDCNDNGVPDSCDWEIGVLTDVNQDGVADQCSDLPRFHRGDTNVDGALDISDTVTILTYLFSSADMPPCIEAADANNDFSVDISDGIFLLLFLFAGQGAPPVPGPPSLSSCGIDIDLPGSPGDLGCESYPPCET